jgi:hypothetical protein
LGLLLNSPGPKVPGKDSNIHVKYDRGWVKLDGVDDYLNVVSTFNFPTYPSAFTIDAWIQTTSTLYSFILAYGSNTIPNSMVSLGIAEGGALKSTTGTDTVTGGFVADGNWHHVAAVKRVGAPTELYIDGKRVATYLQQQVGALAGPTVGIAASISWAAPAWGFEGRIDDVQVFGRALNDDEIAQVRAAP